MSITLIDLSPWGFAPGESQFYCMDCPDGQPDIGHRHSFRCSQHALEARWSEARAAEGHLVPDDVVAAPGDPGMGYKQELEDLIWGGIIGSVLIIIALAVGYIFLF